MPSASVEGDLRGADGVRLHYRIVGSGSDTVVVVHGNPGFHMNYLVPDLAAVADGRALIFYDQRGGGRSELIHDASELTPQKHIEDLEAVRSHFGLRRLTLIGHSWGAGLAAMYAVEYPGNVDRLVLLAPMPVRSDPYAAQAAEHFVDRLNDSTWARLRALDAALPAASDPVELCHELMAGTVAVPLYFANQAAADQFDGDFCDAPPESLRRVRFVREAVNRARGSWDLRGPLSKVPAEALVVHGDHDAIPVAAAREWVSALPNARLLLIPGSDHFVFADGAQQVIPAIVAFLGGVWPRDAQPIH